MNSWSFVHISDTQPGSPRSFRFNPAHRENQQTAYAQVRRLQPELILIGGDLTRDGALHDFELAQAKADLDALGLPYRAIPGNMDVGNKFTAVQGAQEDRDDIAANVRSESLERFARHFGPFPWSFIHRNVRFTGLYAAVAGSGLGEEERLWRFLEALPALARAEHHVVVMHYALFLERMDEPVPPITDPQRYSEWYFSIGHPHRERLFEGLHRAEADIVLSGHIHCRRPVQVIDGIRFYKAAATSFPQWADRWDDGDAMLGFYQFDVTQHGITDTFIPLEQISTRTDGYGPGGHPSPAERDYALAWERSTHARS